MCVQAIYICVCVHHGVSERVCACARKCGGGVRGWVRACVCTRMRVRLYARACVRQYSINSILALWSAVSPEVILCV